MSFDALMQRQATASNKRFGSPAVISQPGHPDKPVTVIFNLNSMDSMGVMTDKPQCAIYDTDLVGTDLKAATITVTGKFPAAKMARPMPDGAGMTTVLLTKA